ncbi:efflux RND transporter periplasmic adaptor subunit [Clostridium cibarium]|uniref:Efflux RND transporter periplasmic adaptor subunit n=1 Tax=Clostridium cibarium TaxID=2762247 RepID=A0ABR8PXF5_9CLOT|nr:efflux RND transporter periplasmic adaptor subunit [Clostridium cibarium]MBD7912819.1 efflux RND transporter periplasmic adaptor subunit [Clostridium cibarium]
MNKRNKKITIYCLMICIVLSTTCYGYNKFLNNKSNIITINTKKVLAKKARMNASIHGTGSVYASISRDISPNNNGKINNLSIKAGDTIEAGTKLFDSESEELLKSLKDAETNLSRQKLTLEIDTKNYNDSLDNVKKSINDANSLLRSLDNELNGIGPISEAFNGDLLKEAIENLDKDKGNLENYIKYYNELLESFDTAFNNISSKLNNIYDNLVIKSPINGVVLDIKHKNGDAIKGSLGSISGDYLKRIGLATVVLIIADKNDLNKKIEITPNYDGIINSLNLKVGDTVKEGQALFCYTSDLLNENIEKIKCNLKSQKSMLEELKNSSKLELDKLNINDAEIQLNIIKEAVNNISVISPINGVVTIVNNKNGDLVSGINGVGTSSLGIPQPTNTILTIIDPTSLKVKVTVDELDITKIKVGQKVQIRFDAAGDKLYEGNVDYVPEVGTPINDVTKYNVIISIDNIEYAKVGMSANISIILDSKKDGLAVPIEAILEKDNKKYVKSKSGNLIEVKTGIENENYVEILDGISEGEEILAD